MFIWQEYPSLFKGLRLRPTSYEIRQLGHTHRLVESIILRHHTLPTTQIEDANGRNIGHVTTENGMMHIFKVGGYCLGWYDIKADKTFKTGGALVGKGNLTALLLVK